MWCDVEAQMAKHTLQNEQSPGKRRIAGGRDGRMKTRRNLRNGKKGVSKRARKETSQAKEKEQSL